MRTSACAALALLALVAATRPAGARTAGDPTPTPTLYRLNQGSTYEQGCFGPCLCPVLIDAPVKGTFALTPTGSDGLFNTYAVTDVNWVVPIDGTDTIVSGSGTYRIGGEFALQQQLSLDLQVGGEKAEHFDSGLVTGPAFPNIKVTISMNGQTCFDTVFQLSASPVPRDQIRSYTLRPDSTFQRGCFGACDCAIGQLEPIAGTFALVPLETTPDRAFAVVDVSWQVSDSSGTVPVSGVGTYKIVGQSAAQQELSLLLRVGDEEPLHLESGLGPVGGNFPAIDVRISVSDATCYDTVIEVHAQPYKRPH